METLDYRQLDGLDIEGLFELYREVKRRLVRSLEDDDPLDASSRPSDSRQPAPAQHPAPARQPVAPVDRRNAERNERLMRVLASEPVGVAPAAYTAWFETRVESCLRGIRMEMDAVGASFVADERTRARYESCRRIRDELLAQGRAHVRERIDDRLADLAAAGYTGIDFKVDDALHTVCLTAIDPAGRTVGVCGGPTERTVRPTPGQVRTGVASASGPKTVEIPDVDVSADAFIEVLRAVIGLLPHIDWLDSAATASDAYLKQAGIDAPGGLAFEAGEGPACVVTFPVAHGLTGVRADVVYEDRAQLTLSLEDDAYQRLLDEAMFGPQISLLARCGFTGIQTNRDRQRRSAGFVATAPNGLRFTVTCKLLGSRPLNDESFGRHFSSFTEAFVMTDWDNAPASLAEEVAASDLTQRSVDQIGLCTFFVETTDGYRFIVDIDKDTYRKRRLELRMHA